jgi:hypothetical protein
LNELCIKNNVKIYGSSLNLGLKKFKNILGQGLEVRGLGNELVNLFLKKNKR